MTTKDLRNNVEKVLGNSIRCLLPSYWWKRLFNQVADTIDENTKSIKSTLSGINGVSITESEDSLYGLNVTEGNIASVITKTRTKISECYRVTPDDISSDIDAAIISKCTPVKAVEVIASPQGFPELSDIEFLFVGLEKTANGWEARALFAVLLTGGMVVAYSLSVEEEEYPGAFILSSNSSLAKFNKLLNTYEFRVLIMDDIPEETFAILDNIISIVDVDTNTYVKGAFWEKLAKEGDSGESNIVINKGVKDVTYAELVNLVITRKLVTGTKYRITDYELKINSDWMRVVERNRWYKIIVTATSNSTLDENAVIEYEYENLLIHGAVHLYKIKYSVFNDDAKYPIANPKYIVVKYGERTEKLYYIYTQGGSFGEYKYMWSPTPYLEASFWTCFSTTENPSVGDVVYNDIDQEYIEITEVVNGDGKGVIYYMEDERGNAAPFDFKNVQFKVYSFSDGYSFVDITGKNRVEWIYAFDGLFADKYISYNGGTYHIPKDYSQVGSIYEGNETQGGRKLVVYPCVNNKLFGYNILEAAPQKIEGGWKFTMSNNTIYGNKNIVFVNNNCIVNDSCDNIVISGSTSNAGEISNVEVLNGVRGEDGSVLVIETPTSASADIKTYIGRDSSGNIKTFNVADENVGGGGDAVTVKVLDPGTITAAGFMANMGFPEYEQFASDGVFNMSVWESWRNVAEDKEAFDIMTPLIEDMFEHNKSAYQKIKAKCKAGETVSVLADCSALLQVSTGNEGPTIMCYPVAVNGSIDADGKFRLCIIDTSNETSDLMLFPLSLMVSPSLEILEDGTIIYGMISEEEPDWQIWIPRTNEDLDESIIEQNKAVISSLSEEDIKDLIIQYLPAENNLCYPFGSNVLYVKIDYPDFEKTLTATFYHDNCIKQVVVPHSTGIPGVTVLTNFNA